MYLVKCRLQNLAAGKADVDKSLKQWNFMSYTTNKYKIDLKEEGLSWNL